MSTHDHEPDSMAITVARIDERTKSLVDSFAAMKTEMASKAELYVTRAEFAPVRTLAYGLVAAVLLTVLGAVLYLVIKSENAAERAEAEKPVAYAHAAVVRLASEAQ